MNTRYIISRKSLETALVTVLTHHDLFTQRLEQFGAQAMAEHVADRLISRLRVHADTTQLEDEPAIKVSPPAPAPAVDPSFSAFFG